MANIIETLEREEIARLGKKIPKFAPGDTAVSYTHLRAHETS